MFPHPESEPQLVQPAAQTTLGEAEGDPDREQAVPSPPVMHQAQPPLLDLIPQVQPSPPKPSALSPSVAPALRPVQLEPVEPGAPRLMEPTAPPSEQLARAETSPAPAGPGTIPAAASSARRFVS